MNASFFSLFSQKLKKKASHYSQNVAQMPHKAKPAFVRGTKAGFGKRRKFTFLLAKDGPKCKSR